MALSTQHLAQSFLDDSVFPEQILLDGDDPWLFPRPFCVDFPMEQADFQIGETSINPAQLHSSSFDKYVCLADVTSLRTSESEPVMRVGPVFSQSPTRAEASPLAVLDQAPNPSQVEAASNEYARTKAAVASLSAAPHDSAVSLDHPADVASPSSILTEQHTDGLRSTCMNAKAPPSDQLHGGASLFHQAVFRIADPVEEADHQTSAVPGLMGNTKEYLDGGLQNSATCGPPCLAEAFSITGDHGPRARQNPSSASTPPEDADSCELQKEAIVLSSRHPIPAGSLERLPSMADSTPKTWWNNGNTILHSGIRQNLRLRNHPRVLFLSIKVPSRDEVKVLSEDASLCSGTEAVANNGTVARQCTGTNLTLTSPLQIIPTSVKEAGDCERLMDGGLQETNDVSPTTGEKRGNSEDEAALKRDVLAKSMDPSNSIVQRPFNMPQINHGRASVLTRCSSAALDAESTDDPEAIPSPMKNSSKSCVTHVAPMVEQMRSLSSEPPLVSESGRATEVRLPSNAIPSGRQGSRGNPIELDESTDFVESKHERLYATASPATPCPNAVHPQPAKSSNMPVVPPNKGDEPPPTSPGSRTAQVSAELEFAASKSSPAPEDDGPKGECKGEHQSKRKSKRTHDAEHGHKRAKRPRTQPLYATRPTAEQMRVKVVDLELAVDALQKVYDDRLDALEKLISRSFEEYARERQSLETSMAREINSIRAAQLDLTNKVETSLL